MASVKAFNATRAEHCTTTRASMRRIELHVSLHRVFKASMRQELNVSLWRVFKGFDTIRAQCVIMLSLQCDKSSAFHYTCLWQVIKASITNLKSTQDKKSLRGRGHMD